MGPVGARVGHKTARYESLKIQSRMECDSLRFHHCDRGILAHRSLIQGSLTDSPAVREVSHMSPAIRHDMRCIDLKSVRRRLHQ
ncbi:hypothetical protein EVAR_40089_1 [Eumeta japonica]|uniref:Uncharacterized protein n=1 Tax=Eumeta variegata TaxID=151549 RepID=A0A4C1X367_EUMVA|nr:hypothetical protein EVAR_40089_1 [Eumeta japonica]